MSSQFVFWRSSMPLDPQAVYDTLMNGNRVDGLEALDLAAVDAAFVAAFPGWTVDARRSDETEQTMLSSPDGQQGLDIGYTAQSVTCTCYGMGPDGWNTVIDVGIELGLPLYDAQTGERFA